MKKNLYFRTMYARTNPITTFLHRFFQRLSSPPKLVFEVFLRRNMGERYFSTGTVFMNLIVLILVPFLIYRIFPERYPVHNDSELYVSYSQGTPHSFLGDFATWYLFTIAFLCFSFLRWKEVQRNPSVFDFGKFSLSSGDINPLFYNFKIGKKEPSVRLVETILEPAVFFLPGVILALIGQSVGWLLIVSAIFYCLGNRAIYKEGDDFVMDKIDEMILNEELEDAFVNGEDSIETRGVRIYADKPESKDVREKLVGAFFEKDAENELKTYAV